jgi:hypothetical protein
MCLEKMTLRFSPAKVTVGSIIPEKITLNIWLSHSCEGGDCGILVSEAVLFGRQERRLRRSPLSYF